MNKEFIPFEQAKALKELGFNEPCLTSYAHDGDLMSIWNTEGEFENILSKEPISRYITNDLFTKFNWVAAPLYQQAFRWFRKEHNLHSQIELFKDCNYKNTYEYNIFCEPMKESNYISYEEAELDCLKRLIEIVEEDTKEQEPTDDQTFNGYGREGGINY